MESVLCSSSVLDVGMNSSDELVPAARYDFEILKCSGIPFE
jgi:hypothetical protein